MSALQRASLKSGSRPAQPGWRSVASAGVHSLGGCPTQSLSRPAPFRRVWGRRENKHKQTLEAFDHDLLRTHLKHSRTKAAQGNWGTRPGQPWVMQQALLRSKYQSQTRGNSVKSRTGQEKLEARQVPSKEKGDGLAEIHEGHTSPKSKTQNHEDRLFLLHCPPA